MIEEHNSYYRPNWDDYFMAITRIVATRSTCDRLRAGAVLVKDNRIISTGYNGTPPGIRNCCDGGCPRCAAADVPSGTKLDECICAHAEENAIVQAAYHGVALKDSMLYCTDSPCLLCAKMIITAGIKEVVYEHEYRYSRQVAALFREAGVRCRQFLRQAPHCRPGRK